MKIARVIARLNVGGPARHVVWLSAGMKADGFETLLVTGTVPPGEDDMSYFAREHGVRPLVLPEMSREISLKDAKTIWKLYRLFARWRPEIVHTHTAKAGTVGRLAGLLYRALSLDFLPWRVGRRRCHFVHTFHGHVFHSYYGALKTRVFVGIERFLARFATDKIVVISEQQLAEIHTKFGVGRREQFAVIPLGLDLSVYEGWETRRRKLRAEFDASDVDILIGIVGRLTEIKNHAMFLRAIACYKDKYEVGGSGSDADRIYQGRTGRTVFMVIGDGLLRGALEEQARQLCISKDELIFTGMRDDPENFYPALDVVALTSHNEGTPLTLIEAMANGRACVATRVGGVVDLLGAADDNSAVGANHYAVCERGIMVEAGDAVAFADAIRLLIANERLRREMGARGRVFVRQYYSHERLLANVAELYRSLTTASPGREIARVGRRQKFISSKN